MNSHEEKKKESGSEKFYQQLEVKLKNIYKLYDLDLNTDTGILTEKTNEYYNGQYTISQVNTVVGKVYEEVMSYRNEDLN